MTPNDTQMDVLMRRYAKGVKESSVSTEHLDADEFNAFAEGALPEATRSRYVSHLADCSECRTVASRLTMDAGVGANAQVPASESIASKTWLQKLSALLSAPALRYAASAVVLLAVVGVALVVWRRTAQQPNSAALVARNEPNANQVNAVNPPADKAASAANENPQLSTRESGTSAQPTPGGFADKKGSESPVADAPPPAPKSAKDAAESETTSTIAADRAMKTPRAESSPSFAPTPPGENYRVDTRQREQMQQQQPSIAGAIHGGPRRNESQEKNKVLDDRARSIDLAKGRDEDRSRSGAGQPASTANKQDNSANQVRPEYGIMSKPSSPPKEVSEERKSGEKGRAQPDEPTSVGGRKFRRQGSVWVDLKFKSSMPVTTVTRGSEEFAALDSKLRSIAQQLGGEVIIVWKGKAFRIR